jgi:membrane protein implicated in regulation of membrane protease activity
MHLVAMAWIYVVLMMALAEALAPKGTVLGAVFTFLLYGLLPLSIVLYVMAAPMRRRARRRAKAQADAHSAADPHGGAKPPGDAVAPIGKEP